tara:strand:+ start:255 stop:512 length:258 start_codon:yes stop_codon:yes gene_type:complete
MKNLRLIFFISFFGFFTLSANEIIKDSEGNFFLMKSDGTFLKLPKPKPGNTYVIKKRIINKIKEKDSIFQRTKKKARKRTNQGFR